MVHTHERCVPDEAQYVVMKFHLLVS
jgi:hypothetical protein